VQLTEIDDFIKSVGSDGFFSGIKLPAGACERCSDSKLTTKIIAQARVSLAKHLKDANEREAAKLGEQF
jgi:Fe-S cluster biogenesis protein NfuA